MDGTTTRQSAGRLPKVRPVVVHAQDNTRGKARPNLLAKQRSTLTPWCLRRSFQEREEKLLLDTDADQNSVTSGRGVPLSKAAKRENSVLSGSKPSKTALQTHNVFSCDSIHNTGDGTLDQCQTDTDPSGRLCIMTDIVVRARATSRTHNIRVKGRSRSRCKPDASTSLQDNISLSV